ncbi:RICIN domain-containing protein [Streptomyces sp. GXMU-J15]|uniref:RICIN domain-containing protein n=1 Tax=Streptomyces fuscus TaxID=3048495 RepID=A0ABT7ITF1_9ACTN|nr:RICIN domain-containing protein [Streptomyces fuscus]MDL2075862.1 RICIN domain-containing protein [Streptomyces fuscus]
MPTPHPPRPPYPPPAGVHEESDDALAARLRGRSDGETATTVALLMARHWRPAQEYAAICLASRADLAAMVTATAFHQVLDRLALGESASALRPFLLVAVRDTVRVWAAEERISAVLPDLQKPSGGRGMRTAKSMTPENRKLAGRSFNGLPGLARCLLWHTEVEAEPITVPAALLGMDTETATTALEQAREKFREGCVLAHRELAPTKDCRFYNRLLDVPIRRGGALLPDVEQHLSQCRYCRSAAEQLSHFEGNVGVLLAEAVLGWGAGRYYDSRPGRERPGTRPRGRARHGGGRRRLLSRVPPQLRRVPHVPRPTRVLRTGVGIASVGLIASVLAATLWGDDGTAPAPSATSGDTGSETPGVSSAPPGQAQLPVPPRQTRLRNAGADLCLDIRDEPEPGAAVELATCSAAPTQQWSYEEDGLLRSAADRDLCLDSRLDAGVVVLGKCADDDGKRADDVRYDLTVQGELLPRWDEQLALASTTGDAGADIVVKVRDGSDGQRWLGDPARSQKPGSLSVAAPSPGAG